MVFIGWPPKEMDGRCFSCGFLAKHSIQPERTPTPGYYEIEPTQRGLGQAFKHVADAFQGQIATEPACYRHKRFFLQEIGPELEGGNYQKDGPLDPKEDILRRLFLDDIKCPQWYLYTPGMGPEKHLEELKMQELEQRRHEFERRIEQDRRDWEYKLEQDRRKWETDYRSEATRIERRITRVLIALAVAEVTAAILQIVFN